MLPLIILAIVLATIVIGRIGNLRIYIWQAMSIGAILVIITGQIGFTEATKAIDLDVMIFLFSMFVIGRALEMSGLLGYVGSRIFSGSGVVLLASFIFVCALASAFLLNDTVAIIGVPIALALGGRKHAKPMLLALAFAITIGSVPSPIGNPQNLLISLSSHVDSPFIAFPAALLLPTLISLILLTLILIRFYPKLSKLATSKERQKIVDKSLAKISGLSLIILGMLILTRILGYFLMPNLNVSFTAIAVVSMAPVLFSKMRLKVIQTIDWKTILFFAAMFVLMQSVWETGFFQALNPPIGSAHVTFLLGLGLSQLVSNVPAVALLLPVLESGGAAQNLYIALAAGSTIAGSLFIFGAASNVIIIQAAESRKIPVFTFWEFARIGIPLTIACSLVYMAFLV